MNLRARRNAARGAFTMMEVLVVIVVLSILLSLTTSIVKRVMVYADEKKTRYVMTIAMEAIQKYYEAYNAYPPTKSDTAGVTVYNMEVVMKDKVTGPLLLRLSSGTVGTDGGLKDGFDTLIRVSPDGTGHRPVCISPGPDGTFGTKDDIFYP